MSARPIRPEATDVSSPVMDVPGVGEVVSLARSVSTRSASARLGPDVPRTVVVGIDGRAGSGKTTIAGHVAAALGDCPLVHMDDIYPGWDGLAASIPILVAHILEPISLGRTARFRRYDWERGGPGEWCEIERSSALVIEGVGSCARATVPFVDVPVWVDAPDEVRKRRATVRDGDVFVDNWDRWRRQEDRLFADDAVWERAALIIDSDRGLSTSRIVQ